MHLTTLINAVSLLAVSVTGTQSTYSLIHRPVLNEVMRSSTEVRVRVQGLEMAQTSTLEVKFTKELGDGVWEYESTTSNVKLISGGHEMDAGVEATTNTRRVKFTGEVLDPGPQRSGAMPNDIAMRLSRATALVPPPAPVKVGDEWSHTFPADGARKLPEALVKYKVVGEEKSGKFDAVKIEVTMAEATGDAPMKSTGFIWVETGRFSTVKLELDVQNVPGPPEIGTLNIKAKQERID